MAAPRTPLDDPAGPCDPRPMETAGLTILGTMTLVAVAAVTWWLAGMPGLP